MLISRLFYIISDLFMNNSDFSLSNVYDLIFNFRISMTILIEVIEETQSMDSIMEMETMNQ